MSDAATSPEPIPPASAASRESPSTAASVLLLPVDVYSQIVAACLDGYPLEACGLLIGEEDTGGKAQVRASHVATNVASSARVYTVDPRDMLRADREAEEAGAVLLGVWHSHTHTDAFPSPTDVAQAPDPGWHYVVVSLRDSEPVLRSYRIRDGRSEEEAVVLQ
ncbi:MAG: M67 family metallopeptidase [Acidimicrobiaceae bacterium]|nr:M67 family metallopeptidase [Acidimicrobiaceae bacterium]MBO0748292.1 M67 family metallopeptidase [Acidimicrobiaceae bacterium]